MDVATLGQVFTQKHTVDFMLKLRRNHGSIMEPSCGDGAFSNYIPGCVSIELDKNVAPSYALVMDFFQYDISNRFNTIIGNPPFVKYKDFSKETKSLIKAGNFDEMFDDRTNLYLFFIYKCILHLEDGGELIFINPREFLKATSSIKLNNFLYDQGTITDFVDLGDARLFGNFTPNCVIWRFQKGFKSRKTKYSTAALANNKLVRSNVEDRDFINTNGQLLFVKNKYTVPFNSLFYVKVGAVSGADEIFHHRNGNKTFVTSETVSTGKTKRFFYNVEAPELLRFKQKLRNRRIKKFNNQNWFMWGRNTYESTGKRIYVNCKTRKANPFFTHDCRDYDGSVLGIFPHKQDADLNSLIKELNKVDWSELGFVCDGRFIFSQRALEGCYLPETFEKYL